MSEEEEDYLSEKILAGVVAQPPPGSKTYVQPRWEAQSRNLAGRTKSKKKTERERLGALREGVGTSLLSERNLARLEVRAKQ